MPVSLCMWHVHCWYTWYQGNSWSKPFSRGPNNEEGKMEVFDQGLNHLPDGIVENPWSDLRDKTEKAADPSIKKQTEEATDFSVAAMLKDPVSRKQLFILREVLDRPQNLWE